MEIPSFVYPFSCQWTFEWFSVFVLTNKINMNIQVQMDFAFSALGKISRRGMVGLYGGYSFNYLRN